jgi:hypothetical protein
MHSLLHDSAFDLRSYDASIAEVLAQVRFERADRQ